MKSDRSIIFSVIPVFLLWGLGLQNPQSDSRVALIVPVTEDAVNLAFDVDQLRSVDIATYERDYKGDGFLHAWNKTTSEWRSVSVTDVVSGRAFSARSAQTVVLGPPKGIPTDLASALSSSGARQVPTLEAAVVINKLDGLFKFSGREWRWLADRHGLKLYDRNHDRRRWGKYGPPEGATSTEPPIGANLGSKSLDAIEVVDIDIAPTEIKTPDEVERTPRLRIPDGKEMKLTGPAIEMEITPALDDLPATPAVPTVSDVADEIPDVAAPRAVVPDVVVPERALPSTDIDVEAPELDMPKDRK